MKKRTACVKRKTKETDISVELDLDGTGDYKVETGISFLNHMLDLFAKNAMIDLKIKAKGDIDVDFHHTVEDIGLALGEALDKALGERKGITRYGWSILPMDEALAQTAIDLGGRPFLVYKLACKKKKIRDFDMSLLEEFFRAMTVQGRLNLHINQAYGDEAHHAAESVFKAVGRSLKMAVSPDTRCKGVPSTKGKI